MERKNVVIWESVDLVTWGFGNFGNLGIWDFWGFVDLGFGDFEIWSTNPPGPCVLVDLLFWGFGDLGIWGFGDLGICRCGDLGDPCDPCTLAAGVVYFSGLGAM